MKSVTRVTHADGRVRYDKVEGSGAVTSKQMPGDYLLWLNGSTVAYSIDSAKREYSEIDYVKLGATISEMFTAFGDALKFTDMKADVDDVGLGPSISGHPTRHWWTTNSMTMSAATGSDSIAATFTILPTRTTPSCRRSRSRFWGRRRPRTSFPSHHLTHWPSKRRRTLTTDFPRRCR